MKKLITSLATIALLFILALPASAGTGPGYSLNNLAPFSWYNPNNESGDLYLYAKDSSTWEVIEGVGRAKMHYSSEGTVFEYELAGFNLKSETDYSLIYYPDPWPGNGLICLGEGKSYEGGKLYMKDSKDTGDLPRIYDWNHPDNEGESTTTRDGGAKIWLVLSSDVDCISQKMTGWNPSEYLFEDETIVFDDTDYTLASIRLCTKSGADCVVDGKEGNLTYVTAWPNFDFTFYAWNLEHGSDYSLIYYADGWPGNHPGALIATGTSDNSGDLLISGFPNLGMNLPHEDDANSDIGAKIWLVPSSTYNSSDYSMIPSLWNPARLLWEIDWVNYIDTDL